MEAGRIYILPDSPATTAALVAEVWHVFGRHTRAPRLVLTVLLVARCPARSGFQGLVWRKHFSKATAQANNVNIHPGFPVQDPGKAASPQSEQLAVCEL